MNKIYYIALYLLGINNSLLTKIIQTIPFKEVKDLFSGKSLNIQYKYNINLDKYYNVLSDKSQIQLSLEKARKILETNKSLGIRTIIINSNLYPLELKKIENPPAIIYLKGKSIIKDDLKSVACIGTRNPTTFGIKAADSIVSSLTKEGFTIISGLAYGIDKQSHVSCLNNKGKTIAVLAHGLDMIYPKENTLLSEEIIKNGGTLISEYPVGTKPDKFRFVERDRIISGLSKGVIVFEAKLNSGTMHTANYALSQNKKIFCPVPMKREEQTLGLIKLLQDKKAIGIQSKDNYDIIVYELGYKIKKDVQALIRSKNQKINKLVKLDKNVLDNLVSTIFDKKTSFGVEAELYNKFKTILKENDLTLKEFFYGVIKQIVSDYYNRGKDE